MTKVTAGVLTGIALGAAHGLAMGWGEPRAFEVFTMVLGRASQGIINGVLAAYVTPGRTPVWRGILLGGAIGLVLGGVAGIHGRNWLQTIPAGGLIGGACGAATARAGRTRPAR
ncbi:MAG TPA: hypothetical protein VF363_11190 [Candidatus Eisenbacteria bacterium]